MASNKNRTENESLSGPEDSVLIVDGEVDALEKRCVELRAIPFGSNNKKPEKDTKLPAQPDAEKWRMKFLSSAAETAVYVTPRRGAHCSLPRG